MQDKKPYTLMTIVFHTHFFEMVQRAMYLFRLPFVLKPFFALAVMVFTLCCGMSSDVLAASNPKYASFVMDSDTGQVLHQRYADKTRHPASLTKVMTLLLAFEAIESGKKSYNSRLKISRHAASMVPSKLDLPVGSSIRMKDAIYALVTKSANDVAVAMAEGIGGTEYNFVRQMNRKAREIGMRRTTFKNPSGLHHSGQVTTARDMAKLANYVIKKYPRYYRFFSTKNFAYRGKSYRNHNRLMQTYPGMDGMKTGYINASGFNLVASAVQNDRRLIGVVFGGKKARSRNAHMAEILDASFKKIKGRKLAPRVASAAQFESVPFTPPVPGHKPSMALAVAALTKIAPATGLITGEPYTSVQNAGRPAYKWVSMAPDLTQGSFGELMGQGDLDPEISDRIEAGMVAVHAVKGEDYQAPVTRQPLKQSASYTPPVYAQQVRNHQRDLSNWSIQVGAFASRAATDQVLQQSIKKLPKHYATARPAIAPLSTDNGWIFRARLSGYTKAQAEQACRYIPDCLMISPQSY